MEAIERQYATSSVSEVDQEALEEIQKQFGRQLAIQTPRGSAAGPRSSLVSLSHCASPSNSPAHGFDLGRLTADTNAAQESSCESAPPRRSDETTQRASCDPPLAEASRKRVSLVEGSRCSTARCSIRRVAADRRSRIDLDTFVDLHTLGLSEHSVSHASGGGSSDGKRSGSGLMGSNSAKLLAALHSDLPWPQRAWLQLSPQFVDGDPLTEHEYVRYKTRGLPQVQLNASFVVSLLMLVLCGMRFDVIIEAKWEGTVTRTAALAEVACILTITSAMWIVCALFWGAHALRGLCYRLCCVRCDAARGAADGAASPPRHSGLRRRTHSGNADGESPCHGSVPSDEPTRGAQRREAGRPVALRREGHSGHFGSVPEMGRAARRRPLALMHSDAVYLCLGLLFALLCSFSRTRYLQLLHGNGGSSEGARAAQAQLQGRYLDEQTQLHTEFNPIANSTGSYSVQEELRPTQLLMLSTIFFATYTRMSPRYLLLLVHFTSLWYGLNRWWFNDLDSNEGSVTRDALALYGILCILFLGGRRVDIQMRSDYLKKKGLTHLNTRRAAEAKAAQEQAFQMIRATDGELQLLRENLDERALSEPLRRAVIDPGEIDFAADHCRLLGRGSFGEVHSAKWRGTPVAVKALLRNRITVADLQAFKRECDLMLGLRHPNIVQLFGTAWAVETVTVFMVMELCGRGTLETLLGSKQCATLSWGAHKLPLAIGVARAMSYLHMQQPPIIHRDLKPENILIDDGYNAKIADFGVSREADDATMTKAGTPLFSAPELMRMERYDESVDVWSFGCCIEVLWTHRQVYAGVKRPTGELLRMVLEGELTPAVPDGSLLCALVRMCAERDPAARPSFKRLCQELQAEDLAVTAMRIPPGPGRSPQQKGKADDEGGDEAEERKTPGRRPRRAGRFELLLGGGGGGGEASTPSFVSRGCSPISAGAREGSGWRPSSNSTAGRRSSARWTRTASQTSLAKTNSLPSAVGDGEASAAPVSAPEAAAATGGSTAASSPTRREEPGAPRCRLRHRLPVPAGDAAQPKSLSASQPSSSFSQRLSTSIRLSAKQRLSLGRSLRGSASVRCSHSSGGTRGGASFSADFSATARPSTASVSAGGKASYGGRPYAESDAGAYGRTRPHADSEGASTLPDLACMMASSGQLDAIAQPPSVTGLAGRHSCATVESSRNSGRASRTWGRLSRQSSRNSCSREASNGKPLAAAGLGPREPSMERVEEKESRSFSSPGSSQDGRIRD